jgi:hypothetical protein
MATWWEITFTGEPTENDYAHVAEMVAQGFTSGQLINEPGDEETEGPATGYHAAEPAHRCSNDCEHAIRAVDNYNQRWRGSRPVF